ncbi:capsid protein [Escherichia coli]|nr:capsid protein [Escherichia coli]EFO3398068.1 capsid protein [Escherichia coli]
MRHVVCKNVSRLAGERSIVRVLNDSQPKLIILERIHGRNLQATD